MNNPYIDRGIIKWEPFDALVGYQSLLKELKMKLNKVDKPVFSEDYLETLNNTLNIAYINDLYIEIFYYENGFIKNIVGQIKKLDYIYKRIILKERITIPVNLITNLEIKEHFYD